MPTLLRFALLLFLFLFVLVSPCWFAKGGGGGAALVFLDLGAADDDDNDEDNFCVAFVEEDVVMLLVVSSLLNSVPIASMTEYMHGDSLSMHSKAVATATSKHVAIFSPLCTITTTAIHEINISVEVRFEIAKHIHKCHEHFILTIQILRIPYRLSSFSSPYIDSIATISSSHSSFVCFSRLIVNFGPSLFRYATSSAIPKKKRQF